MSVIKAHCTRRLSLIWVKLLLTSLSRSSWIYYGICAHTSPFPLSKHSLYADRHYCTSVEQMLYTQGLLLHDPLYQKKRKYIQAGYVLVKLPASRTECIFSSFIPQSWFHFVGQMCSIVLLKEKISIASSHTFYHRCILFCFIHRLRRLILLYLFFDWVILDYMSFCW